MKFPVHIPFVESLGLELLRFENGEADMALTPREEQLNAWGVLHGGVTMTLLDVVMAHAARSPQAATEPDPRGVVTIEMKTSFTRPGLGPVLAKGRVLHRTTSFAFCEASLLDADGALLAHATGTFKYLRALPAGGRQLKRQNASD
ncbi:PaaI family thioesterase [Piscinibacter sp.]|uniref:PaaI family thioesterase n=1 Tax=Piscinibacter sp. TaxID=1903157 RepID=UPI002D1D2200|nr:PaaI family thioesterase [Albitalea sp.]HUG20945.1 PaaI family thioesterase [Albitalea sp.]